MTKERLRTLITAVLGFVLGAVVSALVCITVHYSVEHAGGEDKILQAFKTGKEAVHALQSRDYSALSALVGAEGLRFVAFSTVNDTVDQVFTKEQVKAFTADQKMYIFGMDAASGLVIEKQPAEFIHEYLGMADFSQAPQIAINRVIKTGNAAENVLEFYPVSDYITIDFYYPPSEPNGFDWMSLKTVVKRTGEDCELVAFVRGVYTAQ